MDGYLPLVGVAVGSGLTLLTQFMQHRRERRGRIADLRLASYAEWAAGIEVQFNAYALQQDSATNAHTHDVALCEKRLLLLETDSAIRALIKAVHDAFPALGSPEHHELEMTAHGAPEWEWPPFRDAMDRLLERVRNDLAA